MIKNYQTIIDPGKGNCVAACISSMFDMTIDEVPKFFPMKLNLLKLYPLWNLKVMSM